MKQKTMHPKSLQNLIHAKKGQPSLNPFGRPKKDGLPSIELLLAKLITDDDWEKLINMMKKKALTSPAWAQMLLDRTYGKALQQMRIDQGPPTINIQHNVISLDKVVAEENKYVDKVVGEENKKIETKPNLP
jgi:hypothetical protein